jgi:ribosome-associated protein
MKQNSKVQGQIPQRAEKARGEETLEQKSNETPDAGQVFSPGALDERMLAALSAASDKKALDLVALDLRAVASFTDYFLIASATNVRQVQAISDEIVERLKKQGTRAARVEGYKAAEWVLLDYGDFIVHVFEEKARRFYDLERLWRDAARVAVPPELSGSTAGVAEGDGGTPRRGR